MSKSKPAPFGNRRSIAKQGIGPADPSVLKDLFPVKTLSNVLTPNNQVN